jgi:hypothetical protein
LVCPQTGCNARVMLRICRGTKNPENQGYWYEAVRVISISVVIRLTGFKCTAPAHLSHFICWWYDKAWSTDFNASMKNLP